MSIDSDLYGAPELYDLISPGMPHDLEFYRQAAREAGGAVLELACGTGRVLQALDAAELWGLERSAAMLDAARRKLGERVHLVCGDMRDFTLPRRFSLVLVPYRAFQHLLSPSHQRQALRCIARHLEPAGRLILDLFDPAMELLVPDRHDEPLRFVVERPTPRGRMLVFKTRVLDAQRQHLHENWLFDEVAADGSVLRRIVHTMHLRYSFRWEMHHLLRRCGFLPERLLGDFMGGPWRPGREQIWVARKRATGKETATHADHDMP